MPLPLPLPVSASGSVVSLMALAEIMNHVIAVATRSITASYHLEEKLLYHHHIAVPRYVARGGDKWEDTLHATLAA